MRRFGVVLALGLVALTSGLALAGHEKSGGKSAGPALGGYCPVAYVAMNQAVKGDLKFAMKHKGRRYLFVNADAMKMFKKTPEKFAVSYDSWCATAMAMGQRVASDPTQFTVRAGVTYLFSNAEARQMFDGDAEAMVVKADAAWKQLGGK